MSSCYFCARQATDTLSGFPVCIPCVRSIDGATSTTTSTTTTTGRSTSTIPSFTYETTKEYLFDNDAIGNININDEYEKAKDEETEAVYECFNRLIDYRIEAQEGRIIEADNAWQKVETALDEAIRKCDETEKTRH